MANVTVQYLNEVDESNVDPTIAIRRIRMVRVDIPAEKGDLLSVTQFAEEANISGQRVRKMIADERIRAHKVGEQHVISRDALNQYLVDRER